MGEATGVVKIVLDPNDVYHRPPCLQCYYRTADHRTRKCEECRARAEFARLGWWETKPPSKEPLEMKKCRECGEVKDTNEFPRHGKSFDGHMSVCSACRDKHKDGRRMTRVEVEREVVEIADAILNKNWEIKQLAKKLRKKLAV